MTISRRFALAGLPRMWMCGVMLGFLLSIGVAAEKREATEKQDGLVGKSDKPPLGKITVLVPDKKFKVEGKNKALRVSFDDIDIEKVLNTKELTIDLPDKMPDWLKNLNGQRIRLRGYMRPDSVLQTNGIKRFVFCRDTGICCFGPNPTVYYLIEATMKSGTSVNYIENRHFDIEGVFRIEPEELDIGKRKVIERIYFLDDCQLVTTLR